MRSKFVLAGILGATVAALSACGGKSNADLVASANALYAKHDYKGAIIQLKSALQKNPDQAEARLLLGKALLERGDPVAALVELQKAQELQVEDDRVVPELARAMLAVGDQSKLILQFAGMTLREPAAAADLKTSLAAAYATQGNVDKARATVDEAMRLKPGYAPALMVLARLQAAAGEIDDAIALLDQVLAADTADERAGVLKAEMQLQGKRDVEASLATFRQVLQGHPESVAARSALANILFKQGKVEDARTEFTALKKTAPNHPETLYLEAQLAYADKNYKRTIEITDLILKPFPENVRVLELAGAAEFRAKNYVQAEAKLARALKVAPKLMVSRLLLAQTYLRTGQPDKTLEALQPVLDSGKPDGNSLSLAGEAYLQLGDAKRSEDAFQRALKAAPGDARVRTSAALGELARGNSSGAISELEAVAGTDSGPRADLALISARLRGKDLDGALKAIDGLEKKLPDQALPLHLRGRVLMLKKDLPGAAKSFEAALGKEPGYFPAVASLAALDLATQKPEDARKRFDAFLVAQPKSWQARLALAELDARTNAPAAKVVSDLREAVKANPSEARPHLLLVNQLLNNGDAKAALQAAQEATAVLPNNVQVMDAQGRAELAAGDFQRAASTFKTLTGLQPRVVAHEVHVAEALMAAKDYTSAGQSLRRAAELQPDNLVVQRATARLAMLDGRPQDALAVARRMQKNAPKDATGYTLEGEIESSRKNWDAAIAAYRGALTRAPISENAARLFNALMSAGKAPEAERLAADWDKSHPKDAGFQYFMGDMALARNDFAQAEARYRAVLAILPEHALALNNVAWLMVKQGKPGALAVAEKANALMPGRAALLDTLSIAQEADNQVPKAIDTQLGAIKIAPQDPSLKLRLAKLYIKSGDKARARAELEVLAKLGDKYAGQPEVTALLKSL